jgi:hypothetical protein
MRRLMLYLGIGVAVVGGCAAAASAETLYLNVCSTFTNGPGPLVKAASAPLTATASCGSGGTGLQLDYAFGAPKAGQKASASWQTTAPAGIAIQSIRVIGASSYNIGNGNGWWGEFFWNGGPGQPGRSAQITNNFVVYGCCSATNINSRTVGWFFACTQSSCSTPADLTISALQLTATETRSPTITAVGASNLWYQSGWVRGSWSASFTTSDPSGVCRTSAALGSLTAKPNADQAPNYGSWQQCSQSSVPASFDTRASQGSLGLGEGTMPLGFFATNAAGVSTAYSYVKTVSVDNTTPAVSLSGPTDVPSSAGTQYVTATATSGPSGIASIACSVDGDPAQVFGGASARVPVSGMGQHAVSCNAFGGAVDPAGAHAESPTRTWSMKIGQPTVLGVAFQRLAGLRCHRARARKRIPGRWVTVRRHGKTVKIRTGAHTKVVSVTRCHPRTVRRRTIVVVTVRRHGKPVKVTRVRYVRVVLTPHVISRSSRRVRFGHVTEVSGWLGTSTGIALSGQRVRVLGAADNGLGHFRPVATVLTGSNGTWSARLPAGPSRLIEAIYDGSANTEGSSSGQAHLIVPARIAWSITPRVVPWSGTIHIRGHLAGGYVPPDGVAMRLLIPYPNGATVRHGFRTDAHGGFALTFSYGSGNGIAVEPFRVQLDGSESDYPYAATTTPAIRVTFGR